MISRWRAGGWATKQFHKELLKTDEPVGSCQEKGCEEVGSTPQLGWRILEQQELEVDW